MNIININNYISYKSENIKECYYACKVTGMVCENKCRIECIGCENLIKFYDIKQAYEEGFRPCTTCYPELKNCTSNKARIIYCVKEEIEKNYYKKFSMTQLADTVYVNEDYMGRVFKEVIGQTPLKYHHFIRCEHARELLEDSEISIELIAYKIGYVSTSHFIKLFKSIYGITPFKYRREHEKTVLDSNKN